VHAGLEFEARADAESQIPVYAVGNLVGGILRIADDSRVVHIEALYRRGSREYARLKMGDTTVEHVPIAADHVRIQGPAPVPSSIAWSARSASIVRGEARLCARPGRRCVVLNNEQPLPITAEARVGRWTEVAADAEGVRLHGWVMTRMIGREAGGLGWAAGEPGAISDGCPYYGTPALVAARTPVHLEPDGPVWARLPAEPDSVWAHDTRSESQWVELTFARGVQRAFPGMTCSTGWVQRSTVSWEVLREGDLTMAREVRDDQEGIVLRALPPWLSAAGLRVGDLIVAEVERSAGVVPTTDLDGVRRSLGIGGLFRVRRGGDRMEIRVPLASGCEEPGLGQPAACQPR
jgi:hypothetical protein